MVWNSIVWSIARFFTIRLTMSWRYSLYRYKDHRFFSFKLSIPFVQWAQIDVERSSNVWCERLCLMLASRTRRCFCHGVREPDLHVRKQFRSSQVLRSIAQVREIPDCIKFRWYSAFLWQKPLHALEPSTRFGLSFLFFLSPWSSRVCRRKLTISLLFVWRIGNQVGNL